MTNAKDRVFGERLRRHRQRRTVTQQWLGSPRYTGAHISALENGSRRASSGAKRYLAGKLGLSLEELEEEIPLKVIENLERSVLDARRTMSAGNLDGAQLAFAVTVEEARSCRAMRIVAASQAGLAAVKQRKGRLQDAWAHVEEAIEAVAHEPCTTWVIAMCAKTELLRLAGDTKGAVDILNALLDRLTEDDLRVPAALAPIYGRLSIAYLQCGRDVDAMKAVSDAQGIDTLAVDDHSLACLNLNISWPLMEYGRTVESRKCLLRAEQLFIKLGFREEVAAAQHNLGSLMATEGDWTSARACWSSSWNVFRTIHSGRNEVIALVSLAEAQKALGNTQESIGLLREALAKARKVSPRFPIVAQAHELLAEMSQIDAEDALTHITQALAIYTDHGNQTAVARALRAKGRLLEQHGRADEASLCYKEALAALLDQAGRSGRD